MRILDCVRLLAGLSLIIPAAASAASFDCALAKASVEKLVCADASLSRLDIQLDAAYRRGLRSAPSIEELRREQRDWIRERDLCSNNPCIQKAYRTRIQALADRFPKVFVIRAAPDKHTLEINRKGTKAFAVSVIDGNGTQTQTFDIESSVPSGDAISVYDVDGDKHQDIVVAKSYGASPFASTSLYRFNPAAHRFEEDRSFPGEGFPTPSPTSGCAYFERRLSGGGQAYYSVTEWCLSPAPRKWVEGNSCNRETSCYRQFERHRRNWLKQRLQ